VTTQKMFLTMHPRPTTMWITSSSLPPKQARHFKRRSPGGWLIQGFDKILMDFGSSPPRPHTATYGSKTHISPALAVGGKLTKRVLGSFACLGGSARQGVLGLARLCDVTQRLPRWLNDPPLKGVRSSYAFASIMRHNRVEGVKGWL
jgi:hypothetical protein